MQVNVPPQHVSTNVHVSRANFTATDLQNIYMYSSSLGKKNQTSFKTVRPKTGIKKRIFAVVNQIYHLFGSIYWYM